jgi:hypothetical protein
MRLWGAALLGTVMLFTHQARADCAMPVGYQISEAPAGEVQICLRNYTHRTCPDEGLLRRDTTSGDIVKITACLGDCFLDDCASAGTYQYGLAVPYACEGSACFTQYYERADVAGASPGCVPGGPAKVAATTVPWGDQQDVCSYRRTSGDSGWGCGASPGGAVLGTNLLLGLLGLAAWRWRLGRPRA